MSLRFSSTVRLKTRPEFLTVQEHGHRVATKFVTVLGIAARNGIMLISHYQHLISEEGMAFGPELVLRGAMERLAPILMTAACAGLALVPIVVKGNIPGHEIEHPMAIVILGGLATSTVMNLLLIPAFYGRWGNKEAVG